MMNVSRVLFSDRKGLILSLFAFFAISMLGFSLPVFASDFLTPYCTATGNYQVCTDQADYAPTFIVHIAGSGFVSDSSYLIKVTRPDGSFVTGDGSFGSWPTAYDTVVADANGNFQFDYILDGITGEYKIEVLDLENNTLATHSFTDAPKVGSVSVGTQTGTLAQGTAGFVTYTVTVGRGSGGGSSGSFTADLSITTSLPTGATYSFSPNPVSFTSKDDSQTATLTINTTSATPTGNTSFTVKASTSASDYATGNGTLLIGAAPAPPPKANQTITFGALAGKTYGDSNFAVTATASSGLTVSFGASGNCSMADATTVHITGAGSCTITASQSGNDNYNAAPNVPRSFTINKADRTCTLSTSQGWTRTFDNTASSTSCSVSAGSGDGSMTFTRNSSSITTPDSQTNAGGYYYVCQWTGGSNYNDCPQQTNTLTINKADATVNVVGYTGTYDGDPHGASGTASGVGGVDLSGSLNFGSTFTNVPGGTAHWTFTGGTNYLDESGDVSIVIIKANATISITPYNVTYDGDSHTATGTATGVKSESLSGLDLSGTVHTDAGNYTDTWTFTDTTGNYNNAGDTINDKIAKADAVIKVDGYTGIYDGNAHGASGSATGVKSENLSSSLDLGSSYTDVPGGTAHWTFTGGTNYNDASGDVAIVITKADQTITFGSLSSKTYGDADFTVSATASSGLTVSFGASGNCSMADATTVHITGAGSCTITASQSGNDNYNAAPNVPRSFTINKKAITVTADAKSKTYGYADPALTYTITSGSLAFSDAFTGKLNRTAGENVGTYAITQGTLALNENYALTYVGANLTILPYNFVGFLPPAKSGSVFNRKQTSTIPLKFQLTDKDGKYVSNAVAYAQYQNATGAWINATSTSNPTTSSLFRYSDNQYIFNLATKNLPLETVYIRARLNDGTIINGIIILR